MPLTVVMLEFKTPEELRLLPQTAEEHLQAVEEEEGEAVGEDVSDSSSSSDSSDDEDAVLRATSDVRSLDATRDVSRKKKKVLIDTKLYRLMVASLYSSSLMDSTSTIILYYYV